MIISLVLNFSHPHFIFEFLIHRWIRVKLFWSQFCCKNTTIRSTYMKNQALTLLCKVFLVTILSSFSFVYAEVWNDTEVWSKEKEEHYSQWVKNNWDKNFFNQKTLAEGNVNPFYGLRADCADVVYTMRLAYSYFHQLPFAINDPTGGSKLITNKMSRFDNIVDQNVRVKKFMSYIYNITSTRSLPKDTFAVELNSQLVKSGALILTTTTNHHSWTIKDILNIGVPWLVFNSRVGAASSVVIQDRKTWPNPHWVFEGNTTAAGNAGFRYWKPIDKLQKPQWEQEGYSDEQYKIPLNRWVKAAQGRLQTQNEKPEDTLKRLMEVSCEELKGRVGAIKDGMLHLEANPNACMNYQQYDNYSTPSRDQRFFDSLIELRNSYSSLLDKPLSLELQNELKRIFPYIEKSEKEESDLMEEISNFEVSSYCTVDYSSSKQNKWIDLAEAKRRMFKGIMSNNPHDSFEIRWGEGNKKRSSKLNLRCQSWDPWEPKLP